MTARRLALTATALAVMLATTGAARAAAPWSAPVELGPRANGSQAIGLAFSPRGEGLLGYRLGSSSYIATVRGDGAVGRPGRLPMELAAGPALAAGPSIPTLPGGGGAIIILRRILRPDPAARTNVDDDGSRTRLSWALVGPDGTVGRVRTIATARCLGCEVKLAVNWLGEAVVAWKESSDVRVAYRRAGGSFGAPVTVLRAAAGQYPDHDVAISADGRVLVVDAGTAVRARVRTRTGRFGPTMTVGRGDGSVRVRAVLSNGGHAVVAWGAQDGGEEANEPWIVRAARLRRGGRRFSSPQTLDPGGARNRPEGRIAVAFTPGGKATVAWSAVRALQAFPVMVAAAPNGGRFGPAQKLAASGAVGAVAVRADGAAVVTWSRLAGSQQPIQVFAAVRAAGAVAFGSEEAVAGPDIAFFPPLVALGPVSGQPIAAWGSRPNPQSPAVIDDAVVRVATRAAL